MSPSCCQISLVLSRILFTRRSKVFFVLLDLLGLIVSGRVTRCCFSIASVVLQAKSRWVASRWTRNLIWIEIGFRLWCKVKSARTLGLFCLRPGYWLDPELNHALSKQGVGFFIFKHCFQKDAVKREKLGDVMPSSFRFEEPSSCLICNNMRTDFLLPGNPSAVESWDITCVNSWRQLTRDFVNPFVLCSYKVGARS